MDNKKDDKQLLELLEEMIRKKREEIAGLNKLMNSMQHDEAPQKEGDEMVHSQSLKNSQTKTH